MSYQILLFYKYTKIKNPEKEMYWQKDICKKLDLKCRTILAEEGINGTLEGKKEDTEEYIKEMSSRKEFKDIHWKKSEGTGKAFPKVSVKVRSELVTLGLNKDEDVDPNQTSGKYITADELHKLYESGKEFYVIDMRNDYEQEVGHFENAHLIPMKVFKELPEKIKDIEHLKNKLIVTTCTGGIRCEKASGFLVKHGFTNVYQLYGGMQTYIEKYPNQHFLGKLYVFDSRTVWAVNEDDPDHKVISKCSKCGKPSDNYIDCKYLHCQNKRHAIVCEDCCDENGEAYCSKECEELVRINK